MIRLGRLDLRELTRVLVVANTPLSLFKGLSRCSAMEKLRKQPAAELVEYYERLTSRPKRSELVIGLAYVLLSAILLDQRDSGRKINIDASRLHWGPQIREHLERFIVSTERISAYQQPTISVVDSASAYTSGQVLGPDGRPAATWRNS